MPSSLLHVIIRAHDKPASWLAGQLQQKALAGNEGRIPGRRFFDALWGLFGSEISAFVYVSDDAGTFPTATITPTQANAAGDTVTFTWRGRAVTLTEGATGTDGFSRGGTNAEAAQNLARACNRHPVVGGLFTATSNATTVTLTGKVSGTILHDVVISTNDATAFAFVQPTGGTNPTPVNIVQQIWTGRR